LQIDREKKREKERERERERREGGRKRMGVVHPRVLSLYLLRIIRTFSRPIRMNN